MPADVRLWLVPCEALRPQQPALWRDCPQLLARSDPIGLELLARKRVQLVVCSGSADNHARPVCDHNLGGHPASNARHHSLPHLPGTDEGGLHLLHEAPVLQDQRPEKLQHLLLRGVRPLRVLRPVLNQRTTLCALGVAADHLHGHEVDLALGRGHGKEVALLQRLLCPPRGHEAGRRYVGDICQLDLVNPAKDARLRHVPHESPGAQLAVLPAVVGDHLAGQSPIRLKLVPGQHVQFLVHCRGAHHHARVVLDLDVRGDPAVDDCHHALAPLPLPDQARARLPHQPPLLHDALAEQLQHLRLAARLEAVKVQHARRLVLSAGQEGMHAPVVGAHENHAQEALSAEPLREGQRAGVPRAGVLPIGLQQLPPLRRILEVPCCTHDVSPVGDHECAVLRVALELRQGLGSLGQALD
mmetsp:Transcript_25507/g.73605  ORF Transcript_25507/g.73605 Transcript_25507/m.73605 type:complete len:414 (-) Transcript_25507:968-2209(-)